ncbi:membrane protein, putative [Babesia bigemina]|uniref:Membrane protein, putative n=1 Tax=Babesia bigemina TaxID=5866 RepID=A0A061DCN6_BABBI|nr:membrane protein, putative [Babesia bigemina]CDR95680.1 membrane protein, putative [Babesia bigemina]|eukprot:XP_012767866.1 membrane protein, putative [Babesia bigemina]
MTLLFSCAYLVFGVVLYGRSVRVCTDPGNAAFLPSVGVKNRGDHARAASPFDEAEVRKVNPPLPPPPPREPAQYVLDDALSAYRYANFAQNGPTTRHLACLPFTEVRYQDKGSLVPFRGVDEVVSCYSNKLVTLISNFREWTCAFNPSGDGLLDLSLYNPLSTGSYYAVVFYCAWQRESIALKRAIHQLAGRYTFARDPPVVHGKKPKEKLDDLLTRLDEVKQRHDELVAEARSSGLPDPPRPPLVEPERVTLTMRSHNAAELSRILEVLHDRYSYRWWMPHVGKLKYNKVFCRAYNELYNTSYRKVRSESSRLKYKLSDTGRRDVEPATSTQRSPQVDGGRNLTRVNLILVRLANSLMLSNSRRGLQRMRSAAKGHEKEMHFNEIAMRLLLNMGVLYKDMPLICLYKCTNPVDEIAPVFARKSHKALPFSDYPPFYRPDPFEIARGVLYGLPTLRKVSHLAIPSDFACLGGIRGLANLDKPPSVDEILGEVDASLHCDFQRLLQPLEKGEPADASDVDRLAPFLSTLEVLYKLNLRQYIDAQPVPVVYRFLNP